MRSFSSKFQMVVELLELSERAFIYKLLKKKPNITAEELKAEKRRWYQTRPGAKFGDGEGVVGDPRRFD